MEFKKRLENIVLRCQDGERGAFEELFEFYQPRLKYYVRRLDCNGANIDDILQNVWLAVVKQIRQLKEPKAVSVWLYRVARNKVYDGFRRKDCFAALPEEDEIPVSGNGEPTFDEADGEKLHCALKNLKSYHREVLTLCFIEELSYQSIAEVIGCGIGTVRSRIFYAKQALRKEMERQNG